MTDNVLLSGARKGRDPVGRQHALEALGDAVRGTGYPCHQLGRRGAHQGHRDTMRHELVQLRERIDRAAKATRASYLPAMGYAPPARYAEGGVGPLMSGGRAPMVPYPYADMATEFPQKKLEIF